jgi:hypothetical protein
MYIEILNDDLVGFANTTSRDMLDHLFLFYGRITAVGIEQNFENMRKAWDPQQQVETLFKQIQDCVDFPEAGGVTIGAAQKLSSAYSKIFKSGKFKSACRRWDDKIEADRAWNNFKINFAAAYRQHGHVHLFPLPWEKLLSIRLPYKTLGLPCSFLLTWSLRTLYQ